MLKFTDSSHRPTAAVPAVRRRLVSGRDSNGPELESLYLSYRLAGVLAFSCILACFPSAACPQDAESVGSLERQLSSAVQRDQPAPAIELLNRLAATEDVRAYEAIIKHGLAGSNYRIEREAGRLLVDTASPEVIRMTLAEAGGNRNYRTRIILLAVVSRWATVGSGVDARGEPTKLNALALQVLHDAIGDRSRPVALTALRWIGEVNRRESIGPLISHLESLEKRQRRDRLYFDIIKVLKGFSGHDFNLAGEWRNWWEIAKTAGGPLRDPQDPAEEHPAEKRRRGGKSRTVLYRPPPTFFSVPVDSDRVLFVIDVSESMLVRDPELPPDGAELAHHRRLASGQTALARDTGADDAAPAGAFPQSRERLFRVKKELMNVVEALPEKTRFGILSFSHELRSWGDEAELVEATAERKASAVGWVRNLQAYGATRTDLALHHALSVGDVDTVYLLTDGRPRDESNQKISIQSILQMVKHENRFKRCRIHTISFRQVKSTEMKHFVRELARQNDGVCTLLR